MVSKFKILPIDQEKYRFAKYFWDIEGSSSNQSPYVHSLIPKGIAGLIYIYKGAFQVIETGEVFKAGELIFGAQRNTPGKFELLEETGLLGVSLLPYVSSILLATSDSSLMNSVIRLKNQGALEGLEQELNAIKSNNQRVEILQRTLAKIGELIQQNSEMKFCGLIDEMATAKPADLDYLVTKSELSLRQFQRKFKSLTGYSPTEYLRIARILPVLSSEDPKSLTELALKSGYYDQSHFINQFKKVTDGITPSEYFDESSGLQWRIIGENVNQL